MEVKALYLKIPPPNRGGHLALDPCTIRIEVMLRLVDQVILVCDRAKEISERIQDVMIKDWKRSLAILNLSFKPLQIQSVRVQRPEGRLAGMHTALAD